MKKDAGRPSSEWRIQYKRPTYLGKQGCPISQETFAEFTKKHGEEKSIIYLQALQDFTCQLESILDGGFCRGGVVNTAHMTRKEVIELVIHNRDFLLQHENLVETKITSRPDQHL